MIGLILKTVGIVLYRTHNGEQNGGHPAPVSGVAAPHVFPAGLFILKGAYLRTVAADYQY